MRTKSGDERPKSRGRVRPSLTTGELAERSDVNVQTLRYYERRGLLPEPPRSESGYRQYSTSAVSRIRFIKRAQTLGFTLEQIGDLLALRVEPAQSCDAVRSQALVHREEIERKIADLDRILGALDDLIAACEAQDPSVECPILEALEGRAGEVGRLDEREGEEVGT